jgi:hypothetical protein
VFLQEAGRPPERGRETRLPFTRVMISDVSTSPNFVMVALPALA